MKKGKLLALLLALCLLLQGCTFYSNPDTPLPSGNGLLDKFSDILDQFPPSSSSDATESQQSAASHTPYTEYERADTALREEASFADIVYERPDADALCKAIGSVQALVEDGENADAVLKAFDEVYEDYILFDTMATVAYIRYTLDLNDSFYDEENRWCDEQSPLVEQALEKCYIAMAGSPIRDRLEQMEFGEGFFAYYDEHQVYSNDRIVELMQEESALETEYMSLQSDMTITWQGQECLVEDLLADETMDYGTYLEVYRAYYEKYNPQISEIYAKLIRIRREIARELGYDSYADFNYEFYYQRDYTPDQVEDYVEDVAEELSPYYYTAIYGSYYEESMSTQSLLPKLQQTAYILGGEIATAYDYMEAYELYDFSSSTSKMPGSYMTYLWAYQAPFLYVSPTGTSSDLLTTAHEFGHFVDGYVNCNATSSVDCAEIFSQGLEYLTLSYGDLTESEREDMSYYKLSDSVLTFLSQACYAAFESRVYELDDDELTAENFNRIFLECNEEFGMGVVGMEDILAPGWIDIQHFIIAPFYVISYCLSNDAALQIYQTELADGSGLTLYNRLLHLSADNTLLNLLEQAEMESPFAEGRMAELADFFDEQLTY